MTDHLPLITLTLSPGSPVPGGEPTCQVVMVVGAGRGPLVRSSLNASRRSKIPVKVCARMLCTVLHAFT